MAKRKSKEVQPEQVAGESPTPESAAPPAAATPPTDSTQAASPPPGPDQASQDQPARTEGPADKPRAVLSQYFGDKQVDLIDNYNSGSVGIKLSYADPAERPSEEVKKILKAPEGNYPGLTFHGATKQWRKRIGSDSDPKRAVAVRMDVERRFEAVADQMSHEEKLKAERDQSGDKGPGGPS